MTSAVPTFAPIPAPTSGRSRRFKIFVVAMATLGFLIVAGIVAVVAVGYWYIGGTGKLLHQGSSSMQPTLRVGDMVRGTPIDSNMPIQRGWIVSLKLPPAEAAISPGVSGTIKRVVAVPGDAVDARDGVLVVNGNPVSETYLAPGVQTLGIKPLTLGPNQYYVLGDDRTESVDSRNFGPVDHSLITNHIVKVVSPLDRRNTKLQ